MLIVHAGNRVDAAEARQRRFPPEQVDGVGQRLRSLVEQVKPRLVVSPAAAGADLLVLEAALSLNVAVHVVLPFDRETFRQESVADRGREWLTRYDRVLTAADTRPGCRVVEHHLRPEEGAYLQGNTFLVEHALGAAEGEGILAVAVRPRRDPRQVSVTDDFVDQAAQHGLVCIDLDPGVRLEDRRQAFVAMPFGVKKIGQREVDCDVTFQRLIVPLLEDADVDWDRADRHLQTGVIHADMIERLANAAIVVVDTIGDNPNVYYELGMRHAFADKVTVLLSPQGAAPPFDTRPLRHFAYRLPATRLEDDAALEAIRVLQPVFDPGRLVDAEPDSPVPYYFERGAEGRLRLRSAEQPRRLRDLEVHVQEARERRDVPSLAELTTDVVAASLPKNDRCQLLLQVGIGLLDSGSYQRAVDVLRPLDYTATDGQYSLWVQRLAMSLRRRGEEAEANGEDPEPYWREAQQRLDTLLRIAGKDPETCGIAGGLAKQRGRRALEHHQQDLARAHLRDSARRYDEGADADPTNFYAALNATTTLRVLAQRLGGSPSDLERAHTLLPVTKFFAERAAESEPRDFWARATVAECLLTGHLLGLDVPADQVVAAYAQAAVLGPGADAARALQNQLHFYEVAGDPVDLLGQVRSLFP